MTKTMSVHKIAKQVAIALPVGALLAGFSYAHFHTVFARELGNRTAAAAACLAGGANGIQCADLVNEGFTKTVNGWKQVVEFDSARRCRAFVHAYSTANFAAVIGSSVMVAGNLVKSAHGIVDLQAVDSSCENFQSHVKFEVTVPLVADPRDDAVARLHQN